jgi:translocator protein
MKSNTSKFLISVVGCEVIGLMGGIFTMSEIRTWYNGLVKPMLNPPSWIFGPVWTTLYFLMGVALFLVWKAGYDRADVKQAVKVFFLQLGLNFLWSIFFFNMHMPALALLDILLMWVSIAWTIRLFYKISKTAGWLLVPYIMWVSFAMYLNLMIVLLN